MILYPNAKINLGLNIVSKRNDGFHNIETCFIPVTLTDIIEFIESSEPTSITTSGLKIPDDDSNICVKAWQILNREFGIPNVKIHLHKRIPIGAGLGGGSSDGAFLLKGLAEYFKLNLTAPVLRGFASELGSDCAFFLLNSPAIGTERGNVLMPIQVGIGSCKIILVNPGVHVSTADAYSQVKPSMPKSNLIDLLMQPVDNWQDNIKNDFETSVFLKFPEVKELKDKMLCMGAVYAAMSGSGSTVFGLFKDEVPKALGAEFKDSFVYYEE